MVGKLAIASGELEVLWSRIRRGGCSWFLRKVVKRFFINAGWIFLLPLACVLHAVGFRRLTINTERVGHLACEPDCFLKLKALGQLPRWRIWFVLAPPKRVANSHLFAYWQDHLFCFTNSIVCHALNAMSLRGPMVHRVDDYILSISSSATYYRVNNEWCDRPPLLKLSVDDQQELASLLREFGVPAGAWYVCFHNREGGFSPEDEVIHSHRNASIGSYVEAMLYVRSLGGWCIRMGDPSMEVLPEITNVIDYAHHSLRSERADVLLCAGCRFFVGSSSGLWNVASVFGVPCALANMVPISTLGYSPVDISIPKLLCSAIDKKILTFEEVFSLGIANLRTASAYKSAEIVALENQSEDILDLVKDIYETITQQNVALLADADLQQVFRALMSQHDYGFYSGARLGPRFLHRYKDLFTSALATNE